MRKTEQFEKLIAAAKKYRLVLLAAAAAAVLLLWPGGGVKEETALTKSDDTAFDLDLTERRMEEIISKMAGCGKTSVMLTLDQTRRDVVAQNTTLEQNGENYSQNSETVVIGSASRSGEEVVVLKSVYPVYRGALVVCEGAKTAQVRLEVTQAVCALTGLSSDKVTVCALQN